jgi:hypothetical protein
MEMETEISGEKRKKGAPLESCGSRVTAVGKDKVQREASPRRSGRSLRSPRRIVVTRRKMARRVERVEGKAGGAKLLTILF